VKRNSPYLDLGLAVAFISSGSILVRLARAPSLAVAFFRIFLAACCIAPFAYSKLDSAWEGLSAKARVALAGAGIALALHFATWIGSLSYTSVASSVLLVNTAPLFTLGLSRTILKERVPPVVLASLAVALVGASAIGLGDWVGGRDSLVGDALALIGAFCLSVYHVVGRGLREATPLIAYLAGVWSTAALALGAFALVFRVPLLGYSPRTLLVLLALALVPTLAGHGLVNRSLRSVSATTVGLFLLGEPVGAAFLAYLILGEVPRASTIAGGILVLLALVTLVRSQVS